jgi:hypothetical protein
MGSLGLIAIGCVSCAIVEKLFSGLKKHKERKEKEHNVFLDHKVKELFTQWEENARQVLQPKAMMFA